MVLLERGLCRVPTSSRLFHCTQIFVSSWFKPNHWRSFSILSFYFCLRLPVFSLAFHFESIFSSASLPYNNAFWDYVVFQPMSIMKRMLFTALPFPDQKLKEAVDNGDEFVALLTFFLQRIWLYWSLIVTCKTLLVWSIN